MIFEGASRSWLEAARSVAEGIGHEPEMKALASKALAKL
jgi:hypothetical protein